MGDKPPDRPVVVLLSVVYHRLLECASVCILQNDAEDVTLHIVVIVLDDVLVLDHPEDADLLLRSVLLGVDHLLDGIVPPCRRGLGKEDISKVSGAKMPQHLIVVTSHSPSSLYSVTVTQTRLLAVIQ